MQYNRLLFNFKTGIEALMNNRVRAILTSLGIIFGVASVIAMLAIGNGAEKEILDQIKEVGANNIIVKPKTNLPGKTDADNNNNNSNNNADNNNSNVAGQEGQAPKRNTSPGLTVEDARDILASVPSVSYISPEAEIETQFMFNGLNRNGRLVGVNNNFFEVAGAQVSEGNLFNNYQLEHADPVCIIGKNIKTKLFVTHDPIGQYIKCGRNWLKVVGVLDSKDIAEKDVQKLSIRDINDDIYTPINTMLLWYSNRALVTVSKIEQYARTSRNNPQKGDYHQLDRMVINVKESALMKPTAEVIARLLLRRHNNMPDFEIVIPELLLKQEQKTKNLFNVVLAIIASISLIVGGIGIMNIMLASVLERTKEIGLRMAIGATKRDILMQFVSEAVCISVTGGVIGIFLGVSLSYIIHKTTDIQTIVSGLSIFISFSISIAVGLFFGILPAKRASQYDPVVALRHE